MRYIGIEAVMESEGGSAIFSVVVQSDAFFLSFSEKASSSDKKMAKSLAVSRILLTFVVRVGAGGKERLCRRLE